LAGFATFTIAPGLGLPPQLPGSETAPLLERQLWWLGTVAATGSALALIAFTTQAYWAILAAGLIVLPHILGAPRPDEHLAAVPAALAHHFIIAATIVNGAVAIKNGEATGEFAGCVLKNRLAQQ